MRDPSLELMESVNYVQIIKGHKTLDWIVEQIFAVYDNSYWLTVLAKNVLYILKLLQIRNNVNLVYVLIDRKSLQMAYVRTVQIILGQVMMGRIASQMNVMWEKDLLC